MAVLQISPLFYCKQNPTMIYSTRSNSRMLPKVSCQNRETNNAKTEKDMKEDKRLILQQLFGGVEKLGKGVQNNLSPKQKGDWKDITLMSLSFAVYIYMSQKIVCAYCAWMHMSTQPW